MSRQTILSIVLILLLIAIGYVWYEFGGSQTIVTEEAGGGSLADIAEFQRLRDIQLDTSVFQDPVFQLLEPFPINFDSLSGIDGGRQNPFLPF